MTTKRSTDEEAKILFLQTKLEDPEGSDLTVICGDQTFYCHASVLCSRCPFFKASLNPSFKEGQTRTVVLSDDPPFAVMLMLECLYTSAWPAPEDIMQLFEGDVCEATTLLTVADKYEVNVLGLAAHAIYLAFHASLSSIVVHAPDAQEHAERVERLLTVVYEGEDQVLEKLKPELEGAFRDHPQLRNKMLFQRILAQYPFIKDILDKAQELYETEDEMEMTPRRRKRRRRRAKQERRTFDEYISPEQRMF